MMGCEYAGTTTLATMGISKWSKKVFGEGWGAHDHGKKPHVSGHGSEWAPDRGFLRPLNDEDWPHPDHPDRPITALSDKEEDLYMALSPRVAEFISRLNLHYHTPAVRDDSSSGGVIGHHFDDAIYGPLYWGYGGPGEPNGKDRSIYVRVIDSQIVEFAPQTVLVLVKASPDVIAKRMKENPHKRGVVQEKDIEYVLGRFEEEFKRSLIRHKISLDTSTATLDETVAEFAIKIEPYLTDKQREQLLTRSNIFAD